LLVILLAIVILLFDNCPVDYAIFRDSENRGECEDGEDGFIEFGPALLSRGRYGGTR